jgi:hypothetical protein
MCNLPRRQLLDGRHDLVRFDVVWHVADTGEHDEARTGHRGRECAGMKLRRYGRVGAACHDDGGHANLGVARHLYRYERLECGNILRIGDELRRSQEEADRSATHIVGGR